MNTSSSALTTYLRQVIDSHGGQISFANFMEEALYHPQYGYYFAEGFELGIHGDFTTAPEISPLFAKSLARQMLQLFTLLDTRNILELGAGTGRFAADLLLELATLNHLPEHYYIFEISTTLRKKQRTLLESTCPELLPRVIWLDKLPEKLDGIIIANEVLDALPVHCFHLGSDVIKERCVTWENEKFAWTLRSPQSAELSNMITELRTRYALDTGYESEICLSLSAFIQSIANALNRGVMIFIDYGYGQREYYHPERRSGTLTCFYQHHQSHDPLIHPGLQDITAHVDFTRVIENAVEHDCTLVGYTSQAAFLLGCKLMELAEIEEKTLSEKDAFRLHQAIKTLTLPTEMGERIKVMALSKNLSENAALDLIGFRLQDRRRDL